MHHQLLRLFSFFLSFVLDVARFLQEIEEGQVRLRRGQIRQEVCKRGLLEQGRLCFSRLSPLPSLSSVTHAITDGDCDPPSSLVLSSPMAICSLFFFLVSSACATPHQLTPPPSLPSFIYPSISPNPSIRSNPTNPPPSLRMPFLPLPFTRTQRPRRRSDDFQRSQHRSPPIEIFAPGVRGAGVGV